MRAIVLEEFGPPTALAAQQRPDPVPGPGEVLVEVEYANITFIETRIRAGAVWADPGALPLIPGNGVGGVVSALGEGVDPGLAGRRVITSTGGSGAYAERVAVAADGLFDVPDELDLDVAVALLADGRTATMLLRWAEVSSGTRVLVEAAAGGVGTLLMQLVRRAGGVAIAAVGGADKRETARELHREHAEEVVDYAREGWSEQVRAAVGALDVVFDGVGGTVATEAFGLLDRGGRMVSYGQASGADAEIDEAVAEERGVTLLRPSPTPEELRACTEQALREAVAGRLRPVIGQRFDLERAADAHAAIEARATVGKTLLEVR